MGQHIIVVGAGVIGACTAYYLSLKGKSKVRITVIEKTGIACGASGKAGGFLAYNWSDDENIGPLSRLSFLLHAELASVLGGEIKYGYRRLDTFSAQFTKTSNPKAADTEGIPWLNSKYLRRLERLGTPETTAQVHPRLFTETVLDEAAARGNVEVRCGQGVSKLIFDDERVTGVVLENGDVMKCDDIVICMGPWSGMLSTSNNGRNKALPIEGTRAHSIVIQPQEDFTPHALFTSIMDSRRSHEPEVYPRPDGTVYICGATDPEPLPPSADLVNISPQATQLLEQLAPKISPHLGENAQIIKRQACYLPISADGTPFIGEHPFWKHLYVATGHSCWGILNSPATGKMIAELILDGQVTCLDKDVVDEVSPKERC